MSAVRGKAVVIGCVAEPPLVTKSGPKMVLNVSWIGPHIETLSLLGHIECLQKLCDVRAPTSWLMFGLGRVKDGSPLGNVAHILRQ